MKDFPDRSRYFPYGDGLTPEEAMAELERQAKDVHAYFSGIWKLKGAPVVDAFDLGARIQAGLSECRRLINNTSGGEQPNAEQFATIVGTLLADASLSGGEQPIARALWDRIGLWLDADERPLLGAAADALASLPPDMQAALESGRAGRPDLRLRWEEEAQAEPRDRAVWLAELPEWVRHHRRPTQGHPVGDGETAWHLVAHISLSKLEAIDVLNTEAGSTVVDDVKLEEMLKNGRRRKGRCRLCGCPQPRPPETYP